MFAMRRHRFGLVLGLLATSCASVAPQPSASAVDEEENSLRVSLNSTLNHIRQSYIMGCMDALKSLGKQNVYPDCLEKGKRHAEAVETLVKGEP